MTKILQQQSIAATAGNWADSVTFNQFNPADGTPLDALLTLTGTVQATVSIENLAPTVATINFSNSDSISASAPVFGALGVGPGVFGSVTLPAFQGTFAGTVDFSSPSAQVLSNLSNAQSVSSFVPANVPGAPAIEGAGTFDVGVTSVGTSTISGGGNLAVEVNSVSDANLSLAYESVQPAGPPSDGSWLSDTTGSYNNLFIFNAPLPFAFQNLATTVAQVVAVGPLTSGSSSTASFAQFNPALGRLEDIVVSTSGTLSGSFSAENLGGTAAVITAAESGSFTAIPPRSGTPVSASISTPPGDQNGYVTHPPTVALNLGGFDGTIDDAGTSGQTGTFTLQSPSSATNLGTQITTPATLRAFTGAGTVAVPIATTGSVTVTGPSSLYAVNTQQVSGSVTISYVYAPWVGSAPGAPVPPGSPQVKPGSLAPSTGAVPRTPVWAGPSAGAQPGPEPEAMGNGVSHVTLGSLFGASQPMFIGPSVAAVTSVPNQTFAIEAGVTVTLKGFDPAAGDKLDLSGLLAGASIGTTLANVGQFVSVNTATSTVTISGPNGSASVSGIGAGTSLATLLADHVLIVPA